MSKNVKRLFEGFQPSNYRIELNPDRDLKKIEGTVVITGQKVGRPSQRITLHQNGITITEATIVKRDKKGEQNHTVSRIAHHNTFNEVRLHTDDALYSGQYIVTLRFTGKVQDGMHGIYTSTYELEGQKKAIISTQFESHHAREAFPCIDEPEAKATFDLTLVTPVGEAVIANTPAKSQEQKDNKLITVFETSPKMSTYLLAFAFGDMQFKEAKTKDGVDVRVWATKAHSPESLDFALDVAKRGIEFFADYYGVAYPLAKCDHVAIPNFSSGAMENWGLITYRERCLIADPRTASQSGREIVALVIMHELSHQWFGNLVTMKWWDDLWLNESFANVMEYLGPNVLFPEWEVWNSFITSEGLAALRRDSIAGVQAVKTEVRHPDEISTLFDPSIVYAKGGRLLYMMLNYIGEEDFRKGLKEYFTRHAYGNTTGNDLWAALSKASGKDVAGFMNPWLVRSGFPVITVDQQGNQLGITQRHFLQDPAKADDERLWPVPLLSTSSDVPELLAERSAKIELPSDEYIRVNQGAIGHYIVHYKNPEHLKALSSLVAKQKLAIADRLMLLTDGSMLARAGTQPFASCLQLLQNYSQEDTEPVWDTMAIVIADLRRFIDSDTHLEGPIKALIRSLIQIQYERLGWTEKPGEPSQDTKLRASIIGLGVYSEHPEIKQHALELFEAYKTNPDAIHSELRSIVFGGAIRNEEAGAFEYLLSLDETTQNVDLKQDLMSALTLTKQADKAEILLTRLTDSDKVRLQDVDHWLVSLMRNRYIRDQSWKWLRDNWTWIEKTFAADKSYDYFPRYAAATFNTRELLQEYREFFEPMKDQPALNRNIVMGIEELENRIAWLERDLQGVQDYFTSNP